MKELDVGDVARVEAVFERNGSRIDPDTVAVKVKSPSGATTTYTYGTHAQLSRIAAGMYRLEVPVTEAGVWNWRYESTGEGQAAEQGAFLANAAVA